MNPWVGGALEKEGTRECDQIMCLYKNGILNPTIMYNNNVPIKSLETNENGDTIYKNL